MTRYCRGTPKSVPFACVGLVRTLAFSMQMHYTECMKKILLIGTGGTIASEMTDDGLAPKLDSTQLLRYIPRVKELCAVDCIQLMSVDSTNMSPDGWLSIARCVETHYDAYDGFVISHGTDTMAYTAAALSYLIRHSKKPVVLTGAQKPISMDVTDSKQNLSDAFTYACDERASGVSIVFNGSVILGTRAKKVRSKSFSAFASINFPELAVLQDGRVLHYIDLGYREPAAFSHALNDSVGLVKLIPGTDAGMLNYALDRFDAVIIESFGVGGLPEGNDGCFRAAIERGIKAGKLIMITTQVQNEGSNLTVYQVGHALKQQNIIEAFDMTTEAAVAKLMWIMGETRDPDRVRERFYSPVSHDILYTEAE